MEQPTLVVRLGDSYLTKTESGEILETLDTFDDGSPDWTTAGICDHRGSAGVLGFQHLASAFDNLERNAAQIGQELTKLP